MFPENDSQKLFQICIEGTEGSNFRLYLLYYTTAGHNFIFTIISGLCNGFVGLELKVLILDCICSITPRLGIILSSQSFLDYAMVLLGCCKLKECIFE